VLENVAVSVNQVDAVADANVSWNCIEVGLVQGGVEVHTNIEWGLVVSVCCVSAAGMNVSHGDRDYSTGSMCSSGVMRGRKVGEYKISSDCGCSKGFTHPI
jgi:hypothetical protein